VEGASLPDPSSACPRLKTGRSTMAIAIFIVLAVFIVGALVLMRSRRRAA
jgi:LPXTG-motif cell wall-anchored protein